ncbi:hypothetical protein [Planotetraspora phitsanulokensis]|uniref:Uncharacterized protein n=1 Tax=Planotetraspora phitsanulokensis TaxID=575192 RepID=A0A8J3UDU3_9ACTN|nr:hypothetical protein [Planotetraspora phitsanulokensis]GII42955.1 hypothetical protein Pph01_79580 [Planotetraspora phitsanulokensis]
MPGKTAWIHSCGGINLGNWKARDVCNGCRKVVATGESVEQYRMTRVW